MKQSRTGFALFCAFCAVVVALPSVEKRTFLLYAGIREQAKSEIEEARLLMKQMEDNAEIKQHIPHQQYYNSKVFLDTSLFQFEEEREYETASFYAVLAMIEIETTQTMAKARMWEHKRLVMEKDYFMNYATRTSRSIKNTFDLMSNGFRQDGSRFTVTLFGFSLFQGDNNELSPSGQLKLNSICNIIQQYPRSMVTITGHTREPDENKELSLARAKTVSNYLETKGISSRRLSVRGAGNQHLVEIDGRIMSIDRVEINLTGVR
jgi:outer membrane protein OmpA-like peptidoglycan-associated protein